MAKFLLLSGSALVVFGLALMFEVDRRVGSGLQQLLASMFYSSTIEGYQMGATLLLLGGGTLVALGGCCQRWRVVRR